ncbi:MAG: hypothetical protein JW885_14800 [Deltaproteobacteria bacterium]|nr:hypothetical protein [Candidatus Zymogenaceae bacterium]
MRYFPDEEEDTKGMRDYRRVRDTYDFSMEPRHVALLVVVCIVISVLLFSLGYITGRSTALRGGVALTDDTGEGDIIPITPLTEDEIHPEGDEPEMTFYDTLGGDPDDGMVEEELTGGVGPGDESGSPETGGLEDIASLPTGGAGDDPDLKYYIRVFATTDPVKAQDLEKSLKALGYGAYTKKVEDDAISIRIKWFDTQEEAEEAIEDIVSRDEFSDFTPEIGTGYP